MAKRRHNPLSDYRRIQREIRAIYDPFTAKHCETCPTPCCIQPTRVTPVDVALAEGTGHRFPHLENANPYAASVASAGARLRSLPVVNGDAPALPCEYLHRGRCTFPDDLRPSGCVQFVCGPMYRHLPPETLRRLRRLLRQMEEAHTALLRAVRAAGRAEES